MKTLIGIILSLVFFVQSSFAASKDDRRENIPDFTDMFITDVISLLPPEMNKIVTKKKPQIKAEFNLANFSNSKIIYRISKDSFIEKYNKAPKENDLATWLINSMEDVFLISFSSMHQDPFHDKFRINVNQFLWRYMSQIAVVDYKGYQDESIQTITEMIFDSRSLIGGQKYSALVQLTANLWAAGWKKSGGQVTSVAGSFERAKSKYSNRATLTKPSAMKDAAGKQLPNQKSAKAKSRFSGTIEMYVTSWCPVCKEAEDYIKKAGYSYVKYDIEKDSDAMKRYRGDHSGRGVPLLVVGDNVLRGWSEEVLENYMNE